MKNTRRFRLALFVVALFCKPAVALCGSLPGVWLVQVQNPKHQVVATLKVQFTDTRAENSCMAGNWNTVRVLSATTKVKDFSRSLTRWRIKSRMGKSLLGAMLCVTVIFGSKALFMAPRRKGTTSVLVLAAPSPLGHFTLHRVQ